MHLGTRASSPLKLRLSFGVWQKKTSVHHTKWPKREPKYFLSNCLKTAQCKVGDQLDILEDPPDIAGRPTGDMPKTPMILPKDSLDTYRRHAINLAEFIQSLTRNSPKTGQGSPGDHWWFSGYPKKTKRSHIEINRREPKDPPKTCRRSLRDCLKTLRRFWTLSPSSFNLLYEWISESVWAVSASSPVRPLSSLYGVSGKSSVSLRWIFGRTLGSLQFPVCRRGIFG